MTDYQIHSRDYLGRLLDEVAADIGRAPVEPWLKTQAIERLNRIDEARRMVEMRLTDPPVESEDAKSDATQAPVDYSWQRFQIIEALSRSSVPRSTQQLLEDAKSLAEWVRNG